MKSLMKIVYLLSLLLLAAPYTFAQIEEDKVDENLLKSLREMSLEDILEYEISVASQTPLSMREAPGIVTLITREDIINSGARDLLDILTLLVPGFNFAESEFGALGMGVRGIWAFEGKVLLKIDGIESNEEGFSGIIFGNHYSPENIERIEVIRGPGSVVHGEYAGLGVINIITRDAEDIDGAYAGITYSRMYEIYSHRNVNFGFGKQFDDFALSLTGTVGEGRLSDRDYVNYYSVDTKEYDPADIALDPLMLNLNLKYKGYDFRAILDRYKTQFGIPITHSAVHLSITKDFQLSDDITLTPSITGKGQEPWKLRGQGLIQDGRDLLDTTFSNRKQVNKLIANLQLKYRITPSLHLLSGIEINQIRIKDDPLPGVYELTLTPDRGYGQHTRTSYIGYAQLLMQSDIMNITVGGRFEHNDEFGSAFVPRLAFTKIFDKFHFKLMYSNSYRLPGGRYFDLDLSPERGTNIELELGYQFVDNHFLVVNVYDARFQDLISLQPLPKAVDLQPEAFIYTNADEIRSQGYEIEYKLVEKSFRVGVNFSHHSILSNSVELYQVPNDPDDVLGFPSFKMNFFAGVDISPNVTISPTLTFFGERYGYVRGLVTITETGADVEHILKELEETFIFNLNFRTKDAFVDGLELDLGLKNIFNSNYEYPQPFRGGQAPLPAPSTSLYLRANYSFDL